MTLDHLSGAEIDGAYRRLCGAMLVQTAAVLSDRLLSAARSKASVYYRSELSKQKSHARAWMSGESAVLPFRECCEALDLDEDTVREGIETFVRSPSSVIKRWRKGAGKTSARPINPCGPEPLGR